MAAGPGPLSMTAIAVAVIIGACATLVVRPPKVPASEDYLIVAVTFWIDYEENFLERFLQGDRLTVGIRKQF